MKQAKRWSLLLLALLVLALFCGCNSEPVEEPTAPRPTAYRPPTLPPQTEPPKHPLEQAYKEDPTAFVVFNPEISEYRYIYVPIQEIMEYESLYPDCNGTWFRNQLSDEDRCIYNSYIYAMEHQCTSFELYVKDNDKDFYYIREALSLDSPFLEQNANRYEDIWSQPSNYRGERTTFTASSFITKRWEKKMEALNRCREIVNAMPATCTTDLEKAEYLHRYVCDHVEYVAYENMADNDYLYDAVCKGQTVCDGYSNMLNLLFNLAGIESYEAMGYNIDNFEEATPEELENAGGHTWVVANIDGKFYNFDPTWEDTNDETWPVDLIYFGFSDLLAPVKYLSAEEQRPKCTDTSRDFPYADLVVDNITNYTDVEKIVRLLEERAAQGKYVTVLGVLDGVEDGDFDRFGRIFYSYYPNVEGVSASGRDVGTAALLWLTVDHDTSTETTASP